jgi:hypothetical protein
MGISNIAINTFNSSSSQSLTRSIEADKTKRITSDFLTPEPISYINGSGVSAINGTLKRLPAGSAESGYTDIFYIPNTIDAIKEILLDWKIQVPLQVSTGGGIYYSKTLLLDAIKQIEIKQGSVVVQTIFPGDIYMRNYSELGYLTKNEDNFTDVSTNDYFDTSSVIGYGVDLYGSGDLDGHHINLSLSIPFVGRSRDNARCFLQGGIYTNNLTIKITYNKFKDVVDNEGIALIPLFHFINDEAGSDTSLATKLDTKLVIFHSSITNTEKQFIKDNIVNRVVNTSSRVYADKIYKKYIEYGSGLRGTFPVEVSLENIDINVTHIMFCLQTNIFNRTPTETDTGNVTQFITHDDDGKNIYVNKFISPDAHRRIFVEGPARLTSSWGEATSTFLLSHPEFVNKDVLGVFTGWLSDAELKLGESTTRAIPASSLNSSQEEFGLKMINKHFYILKLADCAFSTAGVPFSRIKNKSLILNLNRRFFGSSAFGDTGDNKRDPILHVCACGTTVQTLSGNTMSFSYM